MRTAVRAYDREGNTVRDVKLEECEGQQVGQGQGATEREVAS